jgi:nucleoid DNA-binding protein
MNWHSKAGKSGLIKMLLKDHGVSKLKAEKAVNAVFDLMAQALRRGERVELPIGWMQTAAAPAKNKRRFQKFKNIQTGKLALKLVTYPDTIILLSVNPAMMVWDPEPAPPPPPPLSPTVLQKGEALEQLLVTLGFPDATEMDLRDLMAAADGNLDWLLSRLRLLIQEERQFTSFWLLCATVHDVHWIRA